MRKLELQTVSTNGHIYFGKVLLVNEAEYTFLGFPRQ